MIPILTVQLLPEIPEDGCRYTYLTLNTCEAKDSAPPAVKRKMHSPMITPLLGDCWATEQDVKVLSLPLQLLRLNTAHHCLHMTAGNPDPQQLKNYTIIY